MMYIRGTGQPCLVLRQPDTEPICLIAERSPKGLIARMDMMERIEEFVMKVNRKTVMR